MYADILVPIPLKNTFTYGVPIEFQKDIKLGMRVEISFGRNKVYSGIVKKLHDLKPDSFAVKPILSLLDKTPIVTESQLKFWEWMAAYYMCSEGEVMNAALPAYLKLEGESIVSINPEAQIDESTLTDDEFILIEALRSKASKS